MSSFSLIANDGNSRAGELRTGHGIIQTPIFMPVGTQGAVKAIEHRELYDIGAQIILGNTYHLYLRPGTELIERAGGLHKFINWQKPILTDSGGYQVFSLKDLRSIEEKGVTFKSHLDGSEHVFTPESVVQIQRSFGSDIVMVLDECTPYPCVHKEAELSNDLTIRWARRCKEKFIRSKHLYGNEQLLFGIVQGSIFEDIRVQSARSLIDIDFNGYAIGGLAVGEDCSDMYKMIEVCNSILPKEKPRYLMGVGTPQNILEAIERGIDMFDCVLPTRNGRNAMVFTKNGSLNLRNAVYRDDLTPIDSDCSCYCCRNFSRAYLRHLFISREILALQLATLHNIYFYLWLAGQAREAILNKNFVKWKFSIMRQLLQNDKKNN